jgi:hypothetical protein
VPDDAVPAGFNNNQKNTEPSRSRERGSYAWRLSFTRGQNLFLGSPNPRLYFSQNRMRALGFSANWVEGSWLFYGEAAIHTGKRVRPNLETFFKKVGGWDEKEQLLSVLGAEYNGF